MELQEMYFVGIVMGWESTSRPSRCGAVAPPTQVVIEFCPGGSISGGRIKPNTRMRDLALTGFMPVGIVYRDRSNPDIHYLCAHNEVSQSVHRQLLADAEPICEAAARSAKYGAHTPYPNLQQSSNGEAFHG